MREGKGRGRERREGNGRGKEGTDGKGKVNGRRGKR